jgi:hypothetical protein
VDAAESNVKHPNLFPRATRDPTNWQEPQGMGFYGWRFENRDENLDRWLGAIFEWDEMGAGVPDRVIGTVTPGNSQIIIIGIESPNGNATIEFRSKTGNSYGNSAPGLQYAKQPGAKSRWQMEHTNATAVDVVGRISAPHITFEAQDEVHPEDFELGPA